MSKHTPSPWLLTIEPTECDGVNVRFGINSPDAVFIASGQSQEHLAGDSAGAILEAECAANGRLIAAAPDMLEALREALEFVADQEDVNDGPDGRPVANKAMTLAQTLRAAIAKATGEAA